MAGCSQPILIDLETDTRDTKRHRPEAADDASLLIQAEARKDAGVAAFDEDAQFAAICDFCSRVLEAVGVALREDAVTPGDAVLARELLGEMVDAYSLREDANTLRVNAAAFWRAAKLTKARKTPTERVLTVCRVTTVVYR